MLTAAARARCGSLWIWSAMPLVVRVSVHGGHQAVLDAEVLVQHLAHRSQAVRRATRVGDAFVLRREEMIVHAPDHGQIRLVFRRGREHDFPGPRRQVAVVAGLAVGGAFGEEPGGFQGHFHAHVAPRQLAGIAFRADGDFFSVDDERVALGFHRAGKPPCTLSYLSSIAKAFGSLRSLTATTSNSSGRAAIARNVMRPIRPKPLIPTFTAATGLSPSA